MSLPLPSRSNATALPSADVSTAVPRRMRFIDSSEDEGDSDVRGLIGVEKQYSPSKLATARRHARHAPSLAPIREPYREFDHSTPNRAVSMDCVAHAVSGVIPPSKLHASSFVITSENEFKVMAASKLIDALENFRKAEAGPFRGSTESLPPLSSPRKTSNSKMSFDLLGHLFGRRAERSLSSVVSPPTLISSTCAAISLQDIPVRRGVSVLPTLAHRLFSTHKYSKRC